MNSDSNIIGVSRDPAIVEHLVKCSMNTKYYAKFLYPDLFSTPFYEPHHEIFDLIDSGARKIAIAAPRGIGKTTIARTVLKKAIHYREFPFIVYLMNSATVAEMQTENAKRDLLTNQLAKRIFGDIKLRENPDLDDTFSKMAWTAYGSSLVLPRGSGQQIRGLNWSGNRPGLLIVDDLEDKDEVRNDEIRKKQKEWFFSDVMKSFDMYKRDWRVVYIDTIKHEDALLQTLIDSDDWESIVLSLCDQHYNSLFPDFMSTEEIKAEVETHRQDGILEVFFMERMNQVTGEHSAFKPQYFEYYDEKDIKPEDERDIENVTIGDPAKTVNPGSAESAVVTIGIWQKMKRYLVREVFGEKVLPDEFYNEVFRQAEVHRCGAVGLEVTGLNEFIEQPFKNEMAKRGAAFTFVPLKPRGGEKKDERIAQLVPLYRNREIYHNRANCGPLEAQLIPHPRGKRKDIADALSYLLQMLEVGMRYFWDLDPGGDPEAEFRELEEMYEKPLSGWRVV